MAHDMTQAMIEIEVVGIQRACDGAAAGGQRAREGLEGRQDEVWEIDDAKVDMAFMEDFEAETTHELSATAHTVKVITVHFHSVDYLQPTPSSE